MKYSPPKFALIFIFFNVLFSITAYSQSLETVIAPHFGFSLINETRESAPNIPIKSKGMRFNGRIDFMNIPDNVSINLTGAKGLQYWDVGLQLRIFNYSEQSLEQPFSLFYGLGLGGNYSKGYSAQKVFFVEPLLSPFVRFQFDTKNNWGIFVEAAHEAVLTRAFLGEKTAKHKTKISNRFLLLVGIPFEFSTRL